MISKPDSDQKSPPDTPSSSIISPNSYAPAFHLTLRNSPEPKLTIATYGYMFELCRKAVLKLAYEFEIFADLVVLTQLCPFAVKPIYTALNRSRHLLVVEEGTLTLGWGAEILARTVDALGSDLHKAARVAAKDVPIPASIPLEEAVLPSVNNIVEAVKKMV